MQQAVAFPEGIHIPGLKPAKNARIRLGELARQACESDLPELSIHELSILTFKQRGRK